MSVLSPLADIFLVHGLGRRDTGRRAQDCPAFDSESHDVRTNSQPAAAALVIQRRTVLLEPSIDCSLPACPYPPRPFSQAARKS